MEKEGEKLNVTFKALGNKAHEGREFLELNWALGTDSLVCSSY